MMELSDRCAVLQWVFQHFYVDTELTKGFSCSLRFRNSIPLHQVDHPMVPDFAKIAVDSCADMILQHVLGRLSTAKSFPRSSAINHQSRQRSCVAITILSANDTLIDLAVEHCFTVYAVRLHHAFAKSISGEPCNLLDPTWGPESGRAGHLSA